MIITLAYIATVKVKTENTEYIVIHLWKYKEFNVQGTSKYYEADERLSAKTVEQIFDRYIDDQEIKELFLSEIELGELC